MTTPHCAKSDLPDVERKLTRGGANEIAKVIRKHANHVKGTTPRKIAKGSPEWEIRERWKRGEVKRLRRLAAYVESGVRPEVEARGRTEAHA